MNVDLKPLFTYHLLVIVIFFCNLTACGSAGNTVESNAGNGSSNNAVVLAETANGGQTPTSNSNSSSNNGSATGTNSNNTTTPNGSSTTDGSSAGGTGGSGGSGNTGNSQAPLLLKISDIKPRQFKANDLVIISGENFSNQLTLTVNGIQVDYNLINKMELSFKAPSLMTDNNSSAQTAHIRLQDAINNSFTNTAELNLNLQPSFTISQIPASEFHTGQLVTLNGTGLESIVKVCVNAICDPHPASNTQGTALNFSAPGIVTGTLIVWDKWGNWFEVGILRVKERDPQPIMGL